MEAFLLLYYILFTRSVTNGAQNPHNIILNEVFIHGKPYNTQKPFIELARGTAEKQVTMQNYSIIVFTANHTKVRITLHAPKIQIHGSDSPSETSKCHKII